METTTSAPTAGTAHHQTLVRQSSLVGGGDVLVDDGLVALLGAVWRRGWSTWASCEDWGDGSAQVVFDHPHQANEFAALLGTGLVRLSSLTKSIRPGPPVAVYFQIEAISGAVAALQAVSDEPRLTRPTAS